jgi:hypothetical protein
VVVAVTGVGVMNVARNEIVRVLAMWNRGMPARRGVDVRGVVGGAVMAFRAHVGIGVVDRYRVLIDVIAVNAVQMAIV